MRGILLVFGSHPVETDLLFDSLDTCLKAEETMRKEYARAYSQGTWGTAVGEAKKPDKVPVLAHNFGGAVGVAI
jgi:predicted urease superfamily metal-dependent hydrolase